MSALSEWYSYRVFLCYLHPILAHLMSLFLAASRPLPPHTLHHISNSVNCKRKKEKNVANVHKLYTLSRSTNECEKIVQAERKGEKKAWQQSEISMISVRKLHRHHVYTVGERKIMEAKISKISLLRLLPFLRDVKHRLSHDANIFIIQ